jgi:uncharacterized membrane protein
MKFRPLRWLAARSDKAGVTAASAAVAMTFQRTLIRRNTQDQAIVTGISASLSYLIASLANDIVEATASWVMFGRSQEGRDEIADNAVRRVTLAFNAFGVVGGRAMQMALPQTPHEPLRTAGLRTSGFILERSSLAGLLAGLTEESLATLDRRGSRDLGLRHLPAPLVAGTLWTIGRDFERRRREKAYGVSNELDDAASPGARAIAMGVGVAGAMTGLVLLNRTASALLGRALDKYLPGGERVWRPLGHMMTLGMVGAALYAQLQRVNRGIEEGTSKIEGAFDVPPESSDVSGSSASLVSWETLGREGRRHVSTYLRKEWIEQVMGEPAIAPVRVFVGLDSAPTEEERVELAINELERAGAFGRKLLVAVSPTGTGYVNYVAVESAEYFTRGNCATVTLQYSKRPSPLSLDRVWEGRKQFRMLLAAIRRRLYKMPPDDRPRLVVFGESLGAHTSQDAFLNSGTQGLQDAGVERGLWIGTPHLSKWKAQVFGKDRPDVERAAVAEFDNFDELRALPNEARRELRYVLLTHGNDGVGHFGFDLLIQQPSWLGDPETRPPGVPRSQLWFPITTFVQTLVDMKNAMNVVPGEFDANGHDYRGDLARFVREVYDLECSDEQMTRVEAALRRYELERQAMLDRAAAAPAAATSQASGNGASGEAAGEPPAG